MAKIVQILQPQQLGLGYAFMAVDDEGRILVGNLTVPKGQPKIMWHIVGQETK